MLQISSEVFPKAILARAIFGALAVSVVCGGAQLAFGRALVGSRSVDSGVPQADINRTTKGDRDAVKVAPAPARTISLRLNGLPNTSVLVHMPPLRQIARNHPTPSLLKSGHRKNAIACEPMVSVLTEVAKLLPPGRCVT